VISLVMLSGGIDSAYVLHKVLAETDDEVLVHHVHLVTDLGRHVPEAKACETIVEYFRKNIRQFHFSESTIDHRRFVAHGFDLIAAGFEAGMVASSFHAVSRGKRWIDRWIVGISKDENVPERRIERAADVARFNTMSDEKPALFLFPRLDVRDQLRAMPRELVDATWSCRRPAFRDTVPMPCGKCQSCQRRNAAFRDVWPEAAD
jgi:7-cyano-7-deazaguanine synthase in queuosine biosynthesis